VDKSEGTMAVFMTGARGWKRVRVRVRVRAKEGSD
jgi:hypothetical protein